MRECGGGYLYSRAKALGCNKIALGHHFDDVIETTVMAMLYGSQLQAMLPKLRSKNFEGMELIRPLYCVREDAVIAWKEHHGLAFLRCACRFTESIDKSGDGVGESKRQEVKALIKELKRTIRGWKTAFFTASTVCVSIPFPDTSKTGSIIPFLKHTVPKTRNKKRSNDPLRQPVPYACRWGRLSFF